MTALDNNATPEIFFKKTLDNFIIIEGFKYFIGDAEFKSVYGEEAYRLFYSDLPNFNYINDGLLKLHIDNLNRETVRFYPGQFLTMDEFSLYLVALKKSKERLDAIVEKVKNYKIEKVRIGDLMKDGIVKKITELESDNTSMKTTFQNAIKDMN